MVGHVLAGPPAGHTVAAEAEPALEVSGLGRRGRFAGLGVAGRPPEVGAVVGLNEGDVTYLQGQEDGPANASELWVYVGSKLRREASISLVTYSGGRPVGIQSVSLQTNGVFAVSDWTALAY